MSDTTETVAEYVGEDGRTYQIDHLGIGYPSQRGEYAVYCDGQMVADFLAFGTLLKPEFQPPLPDTSELIEMAKRALADAFAPE
ncbi:hypothetical protein [Nonomuraea sp. NPDC050310]|uniref:hypothetical protein n=1 Tax=Nonomuraea sp. NPDC050310 TaxID=3154935 RepID=UPI0033CBC7B3